MDRKRLHIKLLYLLIKEDIKALEIGFKAIKPYVSWIIQPAYKIILHSFLLFLFVIGPLAMWFILFTILFDIGRVLLCQ